MNKTEEYKYWSFFRLVRQLESTHNSKNARKLRIGARENFKREFLKFKQKASFGFMSSEIGDYKSNPGKKYAELFVNFMGLLGPDGPMPLCFTEYVFSRCRHHGDQVLADFLDIFHHRMIASYYRAWALNQQTVSFDAPDDDYFYRYLSSLTGAKELKGVNESLIPHHSKVYYSGRYVQNNYSSEGLAAILSSYFKQPITVKEFVRSEYKIPEDQRYYLNSTKSNVTKLGQGIIIGKRYTSVSDMFHVELGPLSLKAYKGFLPGNKRLEEVKDLTKSYSRQNLDFKVRLTLKRPEIPQAKLSTDDAKLSYTSVLGTFSKFNKTGTVSIKVK